MSRIALYTELPAWRSGEPMAGVKSVPAAVKSGLPVIDARSNPCVALYVLHAAREPRDDSQLYVPLR